MKQKIKTLIENALNNLNILHQSEILIDRTRDKQFGDFSCNIALILAKQLSENPRKLASNIVATIKKDDNLVSKIEVAGPGFINFYLAPTSRHDVLKQIFSTEVPFGHSNFGAKKKINFEFVSANPTGPLHVGHGRSVAFGAASANLLEAIGYEVHREYYVNDAGRQMDILATSIWLRYLELFGEKFKFPSNAYKGDYVIDIATSLKAKYGNMLHIPATNVFTNVPADEDDQGNGDKEAHIDGLISQAKTLLGTSSYELVFDAGLDTILNDIRDDLAEFGVHYQQWFSERSLYLSNSVNKYIELLKNSGHTYEKDGNLWFRSTDFHDDKDRVLIRQNRQPTYFAADIAYHSEKFKRGANEIIMIFGADHHGYITRITAALQALGIAKDKIKIVIVQFATLFRGKEKVQMSTRSGSFITLRELREEVGKDAARFFYVLRKAEQHLEFDLELAKSQSSDNPVYYIQYAHARIASVFRQCTEKQLTWDKQQGLEQMDLLTEDHELVIVDKLSQYPEIIHNAALDHEPHLLAHYLRELAHGLHTYYNAHQFLVNDDKIRNARLCLIAAVQQILLNGLTILGVHAPVSM